MQAFHRTKRDSLILGILGLFILLLLATFFTVIGLESIVTKPMSWIFLAVGIALFSVFIRGCWIATNGRRVYIFSIDSYEITWGYIGKEKRISIAEVRGIYWNDTEGFTFMIYPRIGGKKYIRLHYIENVVSHQSRGKLLGYLRENHPSIVISGGFDKHTEKVADEYARNSSEV